MVPYIYYASFISLIALANKIDLGLEFTDPTDPACKRPLGDYRYSTVLHKTNRADESDVYCGLDMLNKPVDRSATIPSKFATSFDLLVHAANLHPNVEHLGVREKLVEPDGKETLGEYKWTTLSESVETIRIIGTALISEPGLVEEIHLEDAILKSGRLLGIWATNCPYWLLTDYASIAYGLITIPLYETLGDEALLAVFEETQMSTVCIDSSKLTTLLKLKGSLKHIRNLIVFDELSQENLASVKELGLKHIHMDELLAKYKDKVIQPPKRRREDIATIVYTSGTGGSPKGALHSNLSLMTLFSRLALSGNRLRLFPHFSTISYLPLSHVYERFVEHYCALRLCRIGYYGGNIRNLLDDIKTLKPHVIVGVPRVFTKILDRINSTIDAKPHLLRRLIRWVARKKKEILRRYPENPHHLLYDIIMKKIKAPFGGRLTTIVMGSASITDADLIDLQNYLTCPAAEGWGTTEVGICFLQDYRDPHKGTIGGPIGDVIFKIRSIPDMEYDARGNPPRGELLMKASGTMVGYFMRPDLTSEALDSEGWYHTGDVVELQPNMAVKILDRARNFFKLSQGEYIAPEKLENLYIKSPYVDQIFIHGESKRNHIVGIIVVNVEAVAAWASRNGLANAPVSTLLNDEKLIEEVTSSLLDIAEKGCLNSLEKLKVFILIDEPFSTSNGLMTPTFKCIRKQIRARYEEEINAMYDSNTRLNSLS
ncbi:acetyl-CoA synthetase-like protein [Babesia gibsoni]|uniref:Acetyl-CoA synthetase-like protein n=1 Tax=Babesia gibsoni TaxID=33632 RepID=A0AAD8US47_BABGI|nr:acetyl-CoA synthetase-like protein [Babesia gibsoni]